MKCYIKYKAALKMKYYVESVDAEISGVGKTKMVGDDIFVEDIIIFKQKCSGTHTDLDQADEAKVMYEREQSGESSKDWNLWWHSHNTMDVFWSGVDEKNIKEQANNGGYLLSIVTNNKGEYKTRFDIFPKDMSPLRINTYYKVQDDIETIVVPDEKYEKELIRIENQIKELEDDKNNVLAIAESKTKKEVEELQERIDNFEYLLDKLNGVMEKLKEKIKEDEKIVTESVDNKMLDLMVKYDNIKSLPITESESLKNEIKQEVAEKVEVSSYEIGFKDQDKYYQDTISMYQDSFLPDTMLEYGDIEDKIEEIRNSLYYEGQNHTKRDDKFIQNYYKY